MRFPWRVMSPFAWSRRCSQVTRCRPCCCSISSRQVVTGRGKRGFQLDWSSSCFPRPAHESCRNRWVLGCRSWGWSQKLQLKGHSHYFWPPTWCWKVWDRDGWNRWSEDGRWPRLSRGRTPWWRTFSYFLGLARESYSTIPSQLLGVSQQRTHPKPWGCVCRLRLLLCSVPWQN